MYSDDMFAKVPLDSNKSNVPLTYWSQRKTKKIKWYEPLVQFTASYDRTCETKQNEQVMIGEVFPRSSKSFTTQNKFSRHTFDCVWKLFLYTVHFSLSPSFSFIGHLYVYYVVRHIILYTKNHFSWHQLFSMDLTQ